MSASDPVQWTFNAAPAASSEACRAVEAWAVAAKLETRLVLNLVLIIEELFTNTIKYGYQEKEGPVRITLACRDGTPELTYADQAPAFDSSLLPDNWEPDIASGRVGGIGLRLIQSMGQNVKYSRDDGWNVLRLSIRAS